jgi:ABC-type sugar transport system ATPase subunit
MIAGLDVPTAGRVWIGERDVTALAPAQRRISMVFQSYALFPHLSVRENILFGVKVRGEPAAEHAAARPRRRPARPDALLERKPSQLSGGQQQRVALGRAIIAETPVCLMDEPLSNLDAQLRQEMRRESARCSRSSASRWLCDPRPDRGDEHGRPGRAAERRPDRAGRRHRPTCTRGRPRSSRRASSAPRR